MQQKHFVGPKTATPTIFVWIKLAQVTHVPEIMSIKTGLPLLQLLTRDVSLMDAAHTDRRFAAGSHLHLLPGTKTQTRAQTSNNTLARKASGRQRRKTTA